MRLKYEQDFTVTHTILYIAFMKVFNLYILKSLLIATVFVTMTLSVIVVLTQSLRFLELIIDAGASAITFWILTLLALPRFWEVIIPLAAMVGTLFVYSRLKDYSELAILRSTGFSPLRIARPALLLGLTMTTLLLITTLWITPNSLSSLQKLRQVVKAQFSVTLLHENVFNRLGKYFTVYLKERDPNGTLKGLLIHDRSQKNSPPTTILAEQGVLKEQDNAVQVIVYNGSRQAYDPTTQTLQRLNFERYTIDLPLSDTIRKRWQKPEERSLKSLISPSPQDATNPNTLYSFTLELHRRITTPLLALTFTLLAASVFIMGPTERNPNSFRATYVILGTILIQGLFIAIYNIAKNEPMALIGLYIVPLAPLTLILFILSHWGEALRRKLLYRHSERPHS